MATVDDHAISTVNEPTKSFGVSRRKNVIYAPKGYFFRKGSGNATLYKDRAGTAKIRGFIAAELARCGWPTHKLKVRQFGNRFFANIGYLRGLDPNALFAVLKSLPSKCGHKKILSAISKLPEQVETDAEPVQIEGAAS